MNILYGLATDDSHNYHGMAPNRSNSGRGWVMVRALNLKPTALINAMESGDFYSSTGVTLKELKQTKEEIVISIAAEKGVSYTTKFIGTRKGYDPKNEPYTVPSGAKLRVTHQYSDDIGQVLATVKGANATYRLKGNELFVRARIISSKPQKNAITSNATQMAWTQPVAP